MKSTKIFFYIVRTTFLEKMSYTKAVWFDIIGTLVSIVIYYFLWKFVFMNRNELEGFTIAQMTTYVILSRILSAQFGGGINQEFSDWVYTGNIGVELLRPVSLLVTLFGKRVGEFIFFVLLKGLPVLAVSFSLLKGAGPAGILNIIFFLISVLIAIVIMFYFEFMVGMCAFYTLNSTGMMFTKRAVLSILSGGIVPLFLFPGWCSEVLNYLPFAGMVSVPVNIFSGKYEPKSAILYLALQCFWAILLAVMTKAIFNRVIRKVVVQGG